MLGSKIKSGFTTLREASRLTPEIKKICSKYTKQEIAECLECDEKMLKLAENIYSQLPIALKTKLKLDKDAFVKEVVKHKEIIATKKNNKKKIKRVKKKNKK